MKQKQKIMNYRIITKEGKVKFANTGLDSWFNLEDARLKLDVGDKIYQYSNCGMYRLFEVL